MRIVLPLLLLLAPGALAAQQPTVPYTPGMVLTSSARVAPGSYPAPAEGGAALVIRGDSITVDMRGVELVGTASREHPDSFAGVGMMIDGGNGITIRGGQLRGYRVAIVAHRVNGLRLHDLDLSYNYRPRLFSGIEKESLIDWMSYHNNEKGEWLAKGAAIYLQDVIGGEVRGVTAREGLNGLLMTRTSGVRVWNSDFSFNSGVGIGLYRSSSNTIMHNRLDYDVRGYSDGFYNRGQDSAGLLIYEQSSGNVVAFNSVTHSGDGLFLWAGQHTMDTGEGGANDNLFYGNDFSQAPTNGIEATFSRNVFVNNLVEQNWHGVWGGYSWQSTWIGNKFRNNAVGIAIEHGQEDRIVGNSFDGDTIAIHLWANPEEPSDWGYPRHRDTRSRDAVILGNTISNSRNAFKIDNTSGVRLVSNRLVSVDTVLQTAGDTSGWIVTSSSNNTPAPVAVPKRWRVRPLRDGKSVIATGHDRRLRSAIIVDRWGPYNWQYPKLWPIGRDDAAPQQLRVLGPAGQWKVVALTGVVSLSAEQGTVGDTLTVVPTGGHENDWSVTLEYTGKHRFTTRFGEVIPAGSPWRFGWTRYRPAIDWHLEFAPWDSTATLAAFDTSAIVATLDTNRLDLTWYRPPNKQIPQADILTQATGTVRLDPGKDYLIRTIADDAVRVWINDKLVIDDWNPGESHLSESVFTASSSDTLRVVHLQRDGWYELRLDIEKNR